MPVTQIPAADDYTSIAAGLKRIEDEKRVQLQTMVLECAKCSGSGWEAHPYLVLQSCTACGNKANKPRPG